MIKQTIVRSLPTYGENDMDDRYKLMYVLTEGAIKDNAVYCGLAPASATDENFANFVAEQGTKLPYEEAASIFSFLDEKNYRR